MNYKTVILIFAIMTAPHALHAHCDTHDRIHNEENQSIASRNQQLARAKAEIPVLNKHIADEQIRLGPTQLHSKDCQSGAGHLERTISITGQAIELLESTLINDLRLQEEVERIKSSLAVNAQWDLSQQVLLYSQQTHLDEATRTKLRQIAKTIKLFEEHSVSWKESAQAMLGEYLSGRRRLSDGLLAALKADWQLVQADYLKKIKSCHDVSESAKAMHTKIEGWQGRLKEIAQLEAQTNQANAASHGRMRQHPKCFNVLPEPNIPRF
jgi:hypothetical protein